MNRVTAAGLLYEAQLDKTVLVVSGTQYQAYGEFRDVLDVALHLSLSKQAWHARGRNRIDLYRGEIRFVSIGSPRALEGLRFDLALIMDDARRLIYTSRLGEQGYMALRHGAARNGAELISD